MPVPRSELLSLLENAFPQAEISIEDTMADQDHYAVTIVCSSFEGLRLVQRHQLVYQALGTLMEHKLHALSLNTKKPGE